MNPQSNKPNHQTTEDIHRRYWQANLRLLATLLSIWFFISFGLGIVMADWLDQFSVAGFKLGFWFAQQGSIYVFVLLIFVYARQMKILDRQFGVDDNPDESPANASSEDSQP
jgi:putative solute:sodium symporter small subunit